MSYDEHLISMAGGDGDLDLSAIEARRADCQTYNFGMRNADKLAHEDVPALLALVREQQAKLDRVEALADEADAIAKRRRDLWHVAPSDIRAAITATEEGK